MNWKSRSNGKKLKEYTEDFLVAWHELHTDEIEPDEYRGFLRFYTKLETKHYDEESQRDVVDRIEETEVFPSHAQTIRMRKLFEKGELNYDKVTEIMEEAKPNQVSKRKFSYENLRQYIPDSYTDTKAEELVIKALDHYLRHLQKQREQSR